MFQPKGRAQMSSEYFVSARLVPGGQLTRRQHRSHSLQPNLGNAPPLFLKLQLLRLTHISFKTMAELPQVLLAAHCALPSHWLLYSRCIFAGKCVLVALGRPTLLPHPALFHINSHKSLQIVSDKPLGCCVTFFLGRCEHLLLPDRASGSN